MSLASSLQPEARVLTLAARTCLDPSAAEQLRTLLNQPLDWERLYRLMLRHGVVALAYRNCCRRHRMPFPNRGVSGWRPKRGRWPSITCIRRRNSCDWSIGWRPKGFR